FPKEGVRARPALQNFNAEGFKILLVPLPVRASGSVPTWKVLFREPQEFGWGSFSKNQERGEKEWQRIM
ncbi:MAG: hypothetical protein J6D46_02055, partial [Lachnospiraceae bacterium]|nr:hypothetical protein [Lachnospiraceae bacterium]